MQHIIKSALKPSSTLGGCLATAICLCISSLPVHAQGGGLAAYEVGAPNTGEAFAGQAAVASDAGTVFLNPAGMTRLQGPNVLIGGQFNLLSIHFDSVLPGNSGGNAGGTFVVPSTYFVQSLGDRLRFGFSFNSPFNAAISYGGDWIGRYFIQDSRLTVLEAQPALAYRLNRWLSLGAGVAIERAAVVRKSAVPNWFDPGYSDGSVNAALHAWGVGASAGVLLEPSDRTRFGISYRSKVDFQMQGKTTLENVGPTTAALLAGSISGATPLHLPQGVNVSVVHSFTRQFTFLADGGWTKWRHFGEKTSQLPGGGSVVTDSNWRDTWRAGTGMRFRISQKLSLQSGVSYDSSPVSSWNRTPDIPVDRQVRLAAGAQYAVRPSMLLGVSYMHLDLGKGDINNVPSVFTGPITGRYSPAKVQFLSFTCTFLRAE